MEYEWHRDHRSNEALLIEHTRGPTTHTRWLLVMPTARGCLLHHARPPWRPPPLASCACQCRPARHSMTHPAMRVVASYARQLVTHRSYVGRLWWRRGLAQWVDVREVKGDGRLGGVDDRCRGGLGGWLGGIGHGVLEGLRQRGKGICTWECSDQGKTHAYHLPRRRPRWVVGWVREHSGVL